MPPDDNRGRSRLKDSLLLYGVYSFVLAATLLMPQLASKSFSDLSFRNTVDISMLEWTGAFLKVFVFLLLLEHFRNTLQTIYLVSASAFLVMGFLDFSYAIAIPGSDKGEWIKILSFAAGSLYFLASIAFFNARSSGFARSLVVVMAINIPLIALLLTIPQKFQEVLPPVLSQDRASLSELCRFIMWMSGGMLIISGVAWLSNYEKKFDRPMLVFSFAIFIFGLVSLTLRSSSLWGVHWWAAHIFAVLTVLVAALYLLGLTMQRSLTWRLLFSLALTFGLTMLVTSGIIQSLLEKNNELNVRRALYAKHLKTMLDEMLKMESVSQQLLEISRNPGSGVESFSSDPDTITKFKIFQFIKKEVQSSPYIKECGFYYGKDPIFYGEIPPEHKEQKIRAIGMLSKEFRDRESGSEAPKWSPPFRMGIENRFFSIAAAKAKNSPAGGIFYCIMDVTKACSSSITKPDAQVEAGEGRFIIDKRTARFISFRMPDIRYEGLDQMMDNKEGHPFSKLLISSVIDTNSEGKAFTMGYGSDSYIVFSTLIKSPNWICTDIINASAVSELSRKNNPKYLLSAVGMIALLIGSAVLLLLLNYQLDRPLKKILSATRRLDSGDFTALIESPLKNELGTLSNSFDNMVRHLRESYQDLERTVHEKTGALEEAEKAGRARTMFFTNLSHELRTPLHGILSFSRLGMNSGGKDPAKSVAYFKSVNESGARLLEMIDEMLDIAKIKSGQMDFSYSKTSLYLLVMQVFSELRASFEEKNVIFVCPEPKFSTEACIDRDKMSRVFRNILGNCLKFSPPGSAISASFSGTGERISIVISDKGPGIPESDLENIFLEFFQSEDGKKIGGTGLGLAISRNIVQNHNGTIYAGNCPGGGAVFTIELPIEQRKTGYG